MSVRSHFRFLRSSPATLALIASHGALLSLYDLAGHPWLTIAVLASAFGALAFCSRGSVPAASTVLLVAVVLRVLLLPLPPTLSDDVLRYLWDGKVATNGMNPYVLAPEAVELETLRDERWQRMPHKEVEAVYPPLALSLFSIAAALPWPGGVWKLLLVACELAGCLLFVRWAGERRIDRRRVLLYAWNPLLTLEVAGMGHLDGVGVALVIAAVYALDRRPTLAGLFAGASVLIKLVPVIALPVWWRRVASGGRFATSALLVIALGLVPLWLSTAGPPPGWVRFGVSWEFNGPLYEPLWRAFDRAGVDVGIKAGLDALKTRTGLHEFWNHFYPWIYPQLLTKGVLAALLALLLWRVWRDRSASVATATGRVFGALILCSSTVYPWYLLWLLPWAAAAGRRSWLALSALITLSYLPQLTSVPLFPVVFGLIWGPFAWLFWREGRWSTR